MFERLLELFLHAKSGAIAAVILLGTTGALVTATAQNGVTTITITEASPSPSASASASPTATATHTASPTATATASPTTSPSASPSSVPSSATDCTTSFEAGVTSMQTVNTAFSKDHTDLAHLRTTTSARTDAARKLLDGADKLLKQIRQNATKAIHDTTSCAKRDEDKAGKKDDDEDEADQDKAEQDNDENDDKASEHKGTVVVVVVTTTTASPTASATASPSPSASTGTTTTASSDPKVIADQAVAAMQLVMDTLKTDLAALPSASPKASHSPQPTHSPRVRESARAERHDHEDDND